MTPPVLARTLLCAFVLLGVPAVAEAAFTVELRERSPHARYWVWVVTDLDLTSDDQPAARVELAPGSDTIQVEWDAQGRDTWIFLHERFQPEGGPPLDLFLPKDLLPYRGGVMPSEPIVLRSVDPPLLMNRSRMSFAPSVLRRMGATILLVFGGGLLLRRRLSPVRARPGRRCAPLDGVAPTAPWTRSEGLAFAGLIGLLILLRLPRFAGASLDEIEVSYLPGIGRPAPFAEGASGLFAVGAMLRELGALYCLDLTHPPLYHAVLGVMGLFGRAEWLLRLPALGLSVATAWLLLVLLRRWSTGAALLAVGLFAAAAPAIYFGQDASPYALVGAVAVGMVHLALRALETGATRHWFAFFGLLVVGFLSHYNVAPFGLAGVALLGAWAWRGRADARWGAALHLAVSTGLKLAPLPVLWAWLHFSTFPTVAQDTRLVADTYLPDPGLGVFLLDFVKVTAGIRADGDVLGLLGALMLLALLVWAGVRRSERLDRRLALEAVVVLTATFVASTLFFYDNARIHLNGKVFYGFRWVGWYHPVLLGALALGIRHGAGPWALRAGLAALWLWAAVPSTVQQLVLPPRPDYEGAAAQILAELEEGDAIASLPPWFLRGNLAYYLFQTGRLRRDSDDGESAFRIDGKRLTMEAVHAGLPFESSARSGQVERLWVAVIQEQAFGRDKFSPAVAQQALAWADAHMEPDGRWEFARLTLVRYRRPAEDLAVPVGGTVQVASSDVVPTARTYPPLPTPLRFVPPEHLLDGAALRVSGGGAPGNRGGLGAALRWHAPMTPSCADEEFVRLTEHFRSEAGARWFLDLRLPLWPGRPAPSVRVLGASAEAAQLRVERSGDALRVQAVGGPCDGPPLVLELSQP